MQDALRAVTRFHPGIYPDILPKSITGRHTSPSADRSGVSGMPWDKSKVLQHTLIP